MYFIIFCCKVDMVSVDPSFTSSLTFLKLKVECDVHCLLCDTHSVYICVTKKWLPIYNYGKFGHSDFIETMKTLITCFDNALFYL